MNGDIMAYQREQEWLRIERSAGSNTSSILPCSDEPPASELCN
jgi:hypothetical protein